MMLDVRLLAIAGPPALPLARLIDGCRAAADGGATAIQVRLKDAPASTMLHLVETLITTVEIPVYVNDRADVALAARAAGVHLGAEDVPAAAVRRIAPPPFRIGVSVGSPAEAHDVRDAAVDYWSVGPISATGTKGDAGDPIGIEGFRRLASYAPATVPVIAIGGITATNAGPLFLAGAAGIAVSAAIFAAPDIRAATAELRRVIEGVESRG